MNGSLKAGRKRRQNNRFPAFASLSVFVLLASFAAIGKLLELHIIAFQICEDGLFRGYPVAGGSVSTLEWVMIVAGLLFFVQVAIGVSGYLSRNWKRVDVAFGALNIVFAASLFVFWAQLWAWWHPLHPLGHAVSSMMWSSPFGRPKIIELGENAFRYTDTPGWERLEEVNGKPVYQQVRTGVTIQSELVYECQPDKIWQANLEMLSKAGRISQDFAEKYPSDNVYSEVMRDAKGRYIGEGVLGGQGQWLLNWRWDPIARRFREELEQNPPSITYDEVREITNEDYELANPEPSHRERDNLSYNDFMERYMREMDRKAALSD